MARKVKPKTQPRPDEGRDDLSVLHPEITLTLAGRAITVREYGFIEGLRLRAELAPLVADLGKLFEGGEGLLEDVLDVLGTHAEAVQRAIAASAGVDMDWVAKLGDAEGDQLVQAWWGVCGPFFVRQIVRRLRERLARAQLAGVSDGATPTPTSPPPDTAPPSSLVDTPSGN